MNRCPRYKGRLFKNFEELYCFSCGTLNNVPSVLTYSNQDEWLNKKERRISNVNGNCYSVVKIILHGKTPKNNLIFLVSLT